MVSTIGYRKKTVTVVHKHILIQKVFMIANNSGGFTGSALFASYKYLILLEVEVRLLSDFIRKGLLTSHITGNVAINHKKSSTKSQNSPSYDIFVKL